MQVSHKWQQPSAHQTYLKLFISIMPKFKIFGKHFPNEKKIIWENSKMSYKTKLN